MCSEQIVKCANIKLLKPYHVLHEKPGDFVGHIKFTVLLMPNKSDHLMSHPVQQLHTSKTVYIAEMISLPWKQMKRKAPTSSMNFEYCIARQYSGHIRDERDNNTCLAIGFADFLVIVYQRLQ